MAYSHNALDITDDQTNSTTPYVVTACHYYTAQEPSNTYYPWEAFDHQVVSGSDWYCGNTSSHAPWLKIDFGSGNAKKVNRFHLWPYSGNSAIRPSGYNFYGSNDDSSYTLLKSDSSIPDYNTTYYDSGAFYNDNTYRYYKIEITSTSGGMPSNPPAIGELEFFTETVGQGGLQKIPHDTARYANNPIELINIANRQRIGIETVSDTSFKTLLHFDGTNGSTTFTDSSGLGLSFSAIGNANLNTSNKKFGTASGYFDGNGDYLACSTIWDFGTSDWTIDFWGKITGGTAGAGIFGGVADSYQFSIYFNRNDNYIYLFNDHASYPSTTCWANFGTALTDAFHHIAIVRSSTSILFFLDGVKKTTGGTQTGTDPICNLIGYNKVIGNFYYGGSAYWQGYIDEFAIRNYAVWTDSFTLPSSAYSTSSTKYHNYIGA